MLFKRNEVLFVVTALFTAIFALWTTFVDTIGLHGDEAWLGLEGVRVLEHGFERCYGMDFYSGMLQSSLNALFFHLFGVSVAVMRSVGIVCNTIALLLMGWFLFKKTNKKVLLFFAVLISQSALFLGLSKVAWEVTSFSFFFLSISVIALYEFCLGVIKRSKPVLFVFLLTTMLAAYSHVIFISLIVGIHVGLVLWVVFDKRTIDSEIMRCYTATGLSILNTSVALVFAFLYGVNCSLYECSLFFGGLLGMLAVQCYFFEQISKQFAYMLNKVAKWRFSLIMKLTVLLLLCLSFCKYHLYSFFRVQSQEVVFNRLFSFQLEYWQHIAFLLVSVIVFLRLSFFLAKDVLVNRKTPWAYILIAYMGLLAVFTQGFSIRYYLILSLLLFIYISYKFSLMSPVYQRYWFAFLFISAGLVQYNMWNLQIEKERDVKAMYFRIGNFGETSAHFINFEPVLDSVFKYRVGKINTTETFFIDNVFEFYKKQYPILKNYKNTMRVEYNYEETGNGYKITTLSSASNENTNQEN